MRASSQGTVAPESVSALIDRHATSAATRRSERDGGERWPLRAHCAPLFDHDRSLRRTALSIALASFARFPAFSSDV